MSPNLSALVVNQMNGKWKFRKGLYREKYQEAVRLCAKFTDLRFRWVPREENEEADTLTRDPMEGALLGKRPSEGLDM